MSRYYRLSYTTIDAAGHPGRRVSYLRVPSTSSLPKSIHPVNEQSDLMNHSIHCANEHFELTDITPTLIQLDSTNGDTLYEMSTSSDHPLYLLSSPDQVNLLNSSTCPIRPCRVIELSDDRCQELSLLTQLLTQAEANIRSSREIIWTCQETIAKDEATKELAQNQLSQIFRDQLRQQCPRCQRVGDHWRELDHGGYYECPPN